MNFYSIINYLKNSGILSFLAPFILIFSILYVIIDEIGIFNIKNYNGKKLNIVVSFSISLIFIISAKYVFVIQNLFPKIAAFLLLILVLNIVATLLNIDIEKFKEKNWFKIFILILIILILIISFISIDKILNLLSFINSDVLSILLIILIIWLITKEPSKKKRNDSKTSPSENDKDNNNLKKDTIENKENKVKFDFDELEKESKNLKPGEIIKKKI